MSLSLNVHLADDYTVQVGEAGGAPYLRIRPDGTERSEVVIFLGGYRGDSDRIAIRQLGKLADAIAEAVALLPDLPVRVIRGDDDDDDEPTDEPAVLVDRGRLTLAGAEHLIGGGQTNDGLAGRYATEWVCADHGVRTIGGICPQSTHFQAETARRAAVAERHGRAPESLPSVDADYR